MNEFYIKIKIRREEIGYTQRYMADSLGVDAATYSRIESGKLDITISRLEAIASLLNIEASSLLASGASNEKEMKHAPKVTLSIDLEDNIKADVIKLAFGDRVLEITNK